jgi:hypothetical protein
MSGWPFFLPISVYFVHICTVCAERKVFICRGIIKSLKNNILQNNMSKDEGIIMTGLNTKVLS